MRRKVFLFVTAVGAIGACDSTGPGGNDGQFPRFEVTNLNSLLAMDSPEIVGVNDRMQVVGHRVVNGVSKGFFWDAGALTELPCLPRALNAKGQVGCHIVTDTGTIPALWDNGTLTPLMQQKGTVSYISDSGHVVGTTRASTSVSFSSLFRWRSGVLTIGPFASLFGRPNNRGEIPFDEPGQLYPQAQVWLANGTLSNGFGTWLRYSFPRAMNDSGVVVGKGERAASARAFLAHDPPAYPFDSIGPSTAFDATDINNLGFVIVQSGEGPLLWHLGKSRLISELVTTPGWTAIGAFALTPGNRVFAQADSAGQRRFVVLTPKS